MNRENMADVQRGNLRAAFNVCREIGLVLTPDEPTREAFTRLRYLWARVRQVCKASEAQAILANEEFPEDTEEPGF